MMATLDLFGSSIRFKVKFISPTVQKDNANRRTLNHKPFPKGPKYPINRYM